MKYFTALIVLYAMTALTGCGPGAVYLESIKGADGHSAAFGSTLAADHVQCTNGGSVLPYGVDSNDNNTLDSTELKGVVVTCNGAPGPQGPQGNQGAAGTPATLVQLCPGTTTYSSTFVEVAFCISGKLYGVYSANGGFLTYFPDGTYSSNGIGSSCNLNVSGCSVTH